MAACIDAAAAVDEADLLENALREGRRCRKQAQQGYNRLKAFDQNRFLESEIVTEQDIRGLCSRIKRRKHADADDLIKLGNAFLQNENNIAAFLNVIGAIDVIVKELTGSDRSRRILAAQCFCNMSLGSEYCCTKIATTAGIYLMICIDSGDFYFARICFWVLQNIAASGEIALNVLMSQEILGTCCVLLKKLSIQDEASKLLGIVIDARWNFFSEKQKSRLQVLIREQAALSFTDPLLLQLYLKTMPRDEPEHEASAKAIIENLVHLLKNSSHCCDLTYFIARTLIELCHNNRAFMAMFAKSVPLLELDLPKVINGAVNDPKLFPAVKELMFLVSLFYKEQFQGLPSVLNFRVTNLRPEQFSVPTIFDF